MGEGKLGRLIEGKWSWIFKGERAVSSWGEWRWVVVII